MAATDTAATITEQVLRRHGAAMGSRNLDLVMSDYADDAVLIDPSGVSRGSAAIRQQFARLLASTVPMSPPSQQLIDGEVALLMWVPLPGGPGRLGAETLVIRGGKIIVQTVAAFAPPP